jgi:hypothetical protein
MYIVPRNPETRQISDQFWSKKGFDLSETLTLLQNTKALPAAAGSFLGWGQHLIHWGTTSGPLASSRMSVSVEFTSRPSDPMDDQSSLLEAHPSAALPSLNARLNLIARAIDSYERYFDPGLLPHLPLAKQIIRSTTPES